MWSLFLERVTPAHDQPCMIWQSMPTEQVMRLKARTVTSRTSFPAGSRRTFVPVLRRAHGRRSLEVPTMH